MGSSDESQVVIAVVALLVSVIALLATFIQVLQQFYASAKGYSQCNEMVMGQWAKTKLRRFNWHELRFEVQFDAPVIFVSPPTNKAGPILGSPIFFLDGSGKSIEETWTSGDIDLRKEYALKSEKERIHTADNERASWLVLLYAVQRMEAKSREWQLEQYEALGPRSSHECIRGLALPAKPPDLAESHSLTVALQRKRKTWDTMPPTMTKPYATTTVCHLVEMMAALGVYWKEFDRTHDRYRAEGNGFMLLGERMTDLGLVFSFQIYGQCTFGRNRVVPVDEVKELCFGYVPTIFRETSDQRRLRLVDEEAVNLSSLCMATPQGISESLTLIGCNNNTIQYFLNDRSQTSHLFPVSFEIVGMLARTFHIENSSFTYIPNPTPHRWDQHSVDLVQMLQRYYQRSWDSLPGVARNSTLLSRIHFHIRSILFHGDEHVASDRLLRLQALHHALDEMDEVLTARCRLRSSKPEAQVQSEQARPPLISRGATTENATQARRRHLVQDVLRSHVQTVLQLLNDRDDGTIDLQSLQAADWENCPSPSRARARSRSRASDHLAVNAWQVPTFKDMNAASPDERQDRFMEVYFEVIRRKAVAHAITSTGRRLSTNSPITLTGPTQNSPRRRVVRLSPSDLAEEPTPAVIEAKSSGEKPVYRDEEDVKDDSRGSTHSGDLLESTIPKEAECVPEKVKEPIAASLSLAGEKVGHDDIWCTLVFRMICWLMLHDFNKADVQVAKSELRGNRMPVYIT